jgi:hypothetical protein
MLPLWRTPAAAELQIVSLWRGRGEAPVLEEARAAGAKARHHPAKAGIQNFTKSGHPPAFYLPLATASHSMPSAAPEAL